MPEAGERLALEHLLSGVAAETVRLFIALGADDPDRRVGSVVARGDDPRANRRRSFSTGL